MMSRVGAKDAWDVGHWEHEGAGRPPTEIFNRRHGSRQSQWRPRSATNSFDAVVDTPCAATV
jgi:hypothetical protein